MPRHLITRAEYARRIGVSRQAVAERVRSGAIPAYGPRLLIDPEEADRLWFQTMSTARWLQGQSRARIPSSQAAAPAESAPSTRAAALPTDAASRAQLATLVTRAQRERLELEAYRASLVSKPVAASLVHAWVGRANAAWTAWPAKAAAALGAELGVDPERLREALERRVHEHLADLAKQPFPELTPGSAGRLPDPASQASAG